MWGRMSVEVSKKISGILQGWHALRNSVSRWPWNSLIRPSWWSMRSRYPPASVSPVLVLPVCTTPTRHLYWVLGIRTQVCACKECVTDDKHPTVIMPFSVFQKPQGNPEWQYLVFLYSVSLNCQKFFPLCLLYWH